MVLAFQSFSVYTALAISRNMDELSGRLRPSFVTDTLEVASRSGMLSAMMAMLFVGCRMYVLATTEGLGEPPIWIKVCMAVATAGISLQVVLVFVLPFTAKQKALEIASFPTITGESCDVHPVQDSRGFEKTWKSELVFGLQILLMCMIYCGCFGVVVGIFSIPSQTTAVSNAVIGTCSLGVLYLGSFMFLFIARIFLSKDLEQEDAENYFHDISLARKCFSDSSDVEDAPAAVAREKMKNPPINAARAMCSTVRKAPMLASVFLAARMRALHLDPPHGLPPQWAQLSFLVVTAAVVVETFAAGVAGAVGREETAYYGVHVFSDGGIAGYVRYLAGAIGYLGCVPIGMSFWYMESNDGSSAPLAQTTICVLWLAVIFLAVDVGQWVVFLGQDLFKKTSCILRDTFLAAGVSASISPLLAIMFISCRMRALQITQQAGSPPGWAQDLMIASVIATLLQLICCILMPLFTNAATHVDADGNPEYDLRPMIGAYFVTVAKYVALFAIYVGLIGQSIAIFTMTPETAHHGKLTFDIAHVSRMTAYGLLIVLLSLFLSSAKVVGLAIKFGIESVDETLIGTNIDVETAKLSIFEGYVNVGGVKVHNPPPAAGESPWRAAHLVCLDRVLVKINMFKLLTTLGKTFEITAVILHGLEVNLEKPSIRGTSNVGLLLQHIQDLADLPLADETPVEDQDVQNVQDLDVVVEKVSVHGVRASAIPPRYLGPTLKLAVASIDFDNFSEKMNKQKGATVAMIVGIILRTILQSVAETAAPSLASFIKAPTPLKKSVRWVCGGNRNDQRTPA
eukprot:TRINITY_DN1942_c0_g1_i1.p1 TRINITY_DN1942_c0_g1~~TRINITY_DN1942_c0_g1_i1.p1  ORF type:complete len:915 (+),score=124.98 TRINITY_DN1942_c0_g1_i1:352-2745(+)